jgi:hypothetical protein
MAAKKNGEPFIPLKTSINRPSVQKVRWGNGNQNQNNQRQENDQQVNDLFSD